MNADYPAVELVKPRPPESAAPPPETAGPAAPAAAPAPPAPGAELAAIAVALEGIRAELAKLNAQVASLIEPPITLNHYRKGAALRIDESQSKVHNPTF